MPPSHALSHRLAVIPQELSQIKTARAAFVAEWQPRLAQWHACLRDRLEEFAILARFGESDQTFVLFGWTPEREVARARAALTADSGEAVIMQLLPLTPEEEERVSYAQRTQHLQMS